MNLPDFQPDPLDDLLTSALRARPDPGAPANLASRAIARAVAEEARAHQLARLGRLMRWSSLAASLLIALLLTAGIYMSRTTTTATETAAVDTTDSSDDTTFSLDLTTSLVILGIAVVGLSVRMVLSPDRPAPRLSMA